MFIIAIDGSGHTKQCLYGINPVPFLLSREDRTLHGKMTKGVLRETFINAIDIEGDAY